jgi:hypothetical protein
MALKRVLKHLTMAPLTITGEEVGTGDGTNAEFTLDYSNVQDGSLTVYVDGVEQTLTTDYTVALSTGVITFEAGSIPPNEDAVTADYISGYDDTVLKATSKTVLIGCQVTNKDNTDAVAVDVSLNGFSLATGRSIPVGATAGIFEGKVVMDTDDELRASASDDGMADILLSYSEE